MNTSINKWQVITTIALASAAIPIVITAFELITTDQESVVFLEHYPPLLGVLILTYYGVIVALGIGWLVKQVVAFINLKNEIAKSELQHLQSQVNPHFFFNILNNLYGLVAKDSHKAQQLILKLSDLMRYSIYDGQKSEVTIAEEADYLRNFIDLHQMRYHKKVEVTFEAKIEEPQLKIMPLLFIILVENAFKHGVEHLRTDAYVHVKLHATRDSVYFEVKNNFDPESQSKNPGMGLSNLKKRLALAYAKKHKLDLVQTDQIFTASLTLKQL